MIINHKYKFIFIHVPKCAGTSIKRALYPYSDEFDQFLGGHPDVPDSQGGVHKHSTALELKHFATIERWDSYFTFSFVRNPLARMVSLYNWWNQTKGNFDPKTKEEISKLSFKEFVFSNHTGSSQLEFLSSKSSKDTFVAGKNRIELDFIGKQETLYKDFAYLCGLFDLPNLNLEKHNVSNQDNKSFRDYYDDESSREIKRKFSEDFEFFNYG